MNTDTTTQTPEDRTSRRELREAERATTTAPSGRRLRHLLPRATVLAVLGALTAVVPAAGFAVPEPATPGAVEATAEPTVGAVPAEESALSTVDAAADAQAEALAGDARILADPLAPVRASAESASRAGAREEFVGRPDDGASGTQSELIPAAPVVLPLAAGSYNLTSKYGERVHPISGVPSMHFGTDFAAPVGTPIHAVTDGVVTYAGPGRDGRSGMIVILQHEIDGQTIYSWYNHMYADGVYVAVGDTVAAGHVIGGVGNNGNSTGPHLHFEIHTDDALTTVDSLAWLTDQGAVDVTAIG